MFRKVRSRTFLFYAQITYWNYFKVCNKKRPNSNSRRTFPGYISVCSYVSFHVAYIVAYISKGTLNGFTWCQLSYSYYTVINDNKNVTTSKNLKTSWFLYKTLWDITSICCIYSGRGPTGLSTVMVNLYIQLKLNLIIIKIKHF